MKNICIIGGGHGTSRLIKGFKRYDGKIDIIVTSSDNGGHTGEVIKEFDVPALGDLRMVLESLLKEPLVDYFSYRFKQLHGKNKVSLGNLMLLSMVLENDGNVNKMLEQINKCVDSKYTLHLANNKYVELNAITKNNQIISGEENIGECNCIKDLYFSNEGEIDESVIYAINNADVVIFSFGSFFTSVGAVIANEKIKDAITKCKAKLFYVANLVNQIETEGYYLEDYVDYIEGKINRKLDGVILSNSKIKRNIVKRYSKEGRKIVTNKEKRDNYVWAPLLVVEDNKLRHDYDKVVEIIERES